MPSTQDELLAAIEAGDPDRVRAALVDDPGAAAARDADGVSALMRARYRSEEMAATIRPLAPPLDVFEAATFGAVDRLVELVAAEPGAAPDAQQSGGWTALHAAAEHGDERSVRALLNAGADPSIVNDEGVGPASLAARSGNPHVVAMIDAAPGRGDQASSNE